MTDKD